jgi:hypothetical protein
MLRASDIPSRLAAGRLREWLRPRASRERAEDWRDWLRSQAWRRPEDLPEWLRSERARAFWESRPEWLRSERARELWENRPDWLRRREEREGWAERGRAWLEEQEAKDVLKGALAGAIGGLIGSWTMVKAKDLVHRARARRLETERMERAARPAREYARVGVQEETERFEQESGEQRREWRREQLRIAEEEPATEKLAHSISRRILRREPSERGKRIGGQAVHYGYGAAMGAIYGGAAEMAPRVTTGFGMPAGALMWAVGDELAVPALKLRKHPREYPLSQHATYLGMHLIFGATTELVRRTLRRMMD